MSAEWQATNETETMRLFRIRRTCIQMLSDRGYEISQQDAKLSDKAAEFATFLKDKVKAREPGMADADAAQRLYRDDLMIVAPRAEQRRAEWEWKQDPQDQRVWQNRHDLKYYSKHDWFKQQWTDYEWDAAERRRGPDMELGGQNRKQYYTRRQWQPEWKEKWADAENEFKDEENDSIVVFFVGSKNKLAEVDIRKYYQVMVERGSKKCIVVSPIHPTPACKYAINACEAADVGREKFFEIFLESELVINVMRHELVPIHDPLKLHEKWELLHALKIKESQLPRLQMADPVARHYGLRKGDVVRITRPSETAGQYVTYRLVQL